MKRRTPPDQTVEDMLGVLDEFLDYFDPSKMATAGRILVETAQGGRYRPGNAEDVAIRWRTRIEALRGLSAWVREAIVRGPSLLRRVGYGRARSRKVQQEPVRNWHRAILSKVRA